MEGFAFGPEFGHCGFEFRASLFGGGPVIGVVALIVPPDFKGFFHICADCFALESDLLGVEGVGYFFAAGGYVAPVFDGVGPC